MIYEVLRAAGSLEIVDAKDYIFTNFSIISVGGRVRMNWRYELGELRLSWPVMCPDFRSKSILFFWTQIRFPLMAK